MTRRVLVTGAGGYVGRQTLAPLASLGFEIHGVARRAFDLPPCRCHVADALDAAAMSRVIATVRPTHLLHLAWTTEHGKFWDDPANPAWRDATLALLREFARAGGQRFVTAGSCAEYSWEGTGPLSEARTPLRPAAPYGQAKLETFQAAQAFSAEGGVSFAHGRLFFSYGPYEQRQRVVPSIILPLLASAPARLTDGRQQRDFVDVRDVGRCLAALLASEVEGAVNIASGSPVAIAEMARMLAEIVGRPDLIQLGALPARADDPPSIVADVGRLTGEVNVSAEIRLEAGLADAVRWWRARG